MSGRFAGPAVSRRVSSLCADEYGSCTATAAVFVVEVGLVREKGKMEEDRQRGFLVLLTLVSCSSILLLFCLCLSLWSTMTFS